MYIGEVSELTGISIRSLRHYHRIGALPEPRRTPAGYRDYDVSDVVRVLRIRRLADSGWALREVARVLGDPEAIDLRAEIAAVRASIQDEIETRRRRLARLDELEREAGLGVGVDPLPVDVREALRLLRREARGRPAVVDLVDREATLLEFTALKVGVPQALAVLFSELATDSTLRGRYLDVLAGFHALEGARPSDHEDEIQELVDLLLDNPHLRSMLDPSAVAPPGGSPDAGAAPTLEQLVPDPAQREVVRRVVDSARHDGAS